MCLPPAALLTTTALRSNSAAPLLILPAAIRLGFTARANYATYTEVGMPICSDILRCFCRILSLVSQFIEYLASQHSLTRRMQCIHCWLSLCSEYGTLTVFAITIIEKNHAHGRSRYNSRGGSRSPRPLFLLVISACKSCVRVLRYARLDSFTL